MNKDFQSWMTKKQEIDTQNKIPIFKEGEIWWAAIGENVGVEINGKNKEFSRPVVILKKLSRFGFWAIPLTSQKHFGSWYSNFNFKGKEQFASLSQVRILSTARLYNRMGSLSKRDFTKSKTAFHDLFG